MLKQTWWVDASVYATELTFSPRDRDAAHIAFGAIQCARFVAAINNPATATRNATEKCRLSKRKFARLCPRSYDKERGRIYQPQQTADRGKARENTPS
jgi:cell division protein FtsN